MNIVLIPGFMTDASLWDKVLPAFQTLGPVTHGDTSQASTVTEMARSILSRAPERFALVGFSLGGYVAREIARVEPERVQGLVLVATSARADTPEQTRRKEVAVRMIDPQRFRGFSRPGVLISLHPDRARDAAMIEQVRAMSERVGADVFRRHSSQFRESDLLHLSVLRCPTLVVAADRDALRSLDEAEELRDGINGATLIVIRESGHMIPLEQPEALAGAIVQWLRERITPAGS